MQPGCSPVARCDSLVMVLCVVSGAGLEGQGVHNGVLLRAAGDTEVCLKTAMGTCTWPVPRLGWCISCLGLWGTAYVAKTHLSQHLWCGMRMTVQPEGMGLLGHCCEAAPDDGFDCVMACGMLQLKDGCSRGSMSCRCY
jgi:hypothetical protein